MTFVNWPLRVNLRKLFNPNVDYVSDPMTSKYDEGGPYCNTWCNNSFSAL